MAMIANLHSAPCKHADLSNIERAPYQVNSLLCVLSIFESTSEI